MVFWNCRTATMCEAPIAALQVICDPAAFQVMRCQLWSTLALAVAFQYDEAHPMHHDPPDGLREFESLRCYRSASNSTARQRVRRLTLILFLTLLSSSGFSQNLPDFLQPVDGAETGNGFNVIFVSLTNTRADHLGVYGYSRNTSTNIDRFAQRSIVFKNFFSHASWTLPVAISLFTSQYPFTHKLMNREDALALPPSVPTFAEVLKSSGYTTAAFVGDRDYSPKYGHTSRFHIVQDAVNQNDQEDWHRYGVMQNTRPSPRR